MNILGITVDTFPTYRQLKSVGFTEAQAEALIDSFRNLNEELVKGLITKEAFDASIAKLQQRINEMEARLNEKISKLDNKIESSEVRLNNKIDILAKDLTIKIGYMLAASVGLIKLV